MAIDPKIIITDGTAIVDLLQGGWKLADPYWNPQMSQYKGGGTFVNAQLAEGQRMVHREYSNVIEAIPLSLRGTNQAQAMGTAHDALALLRQASDYWTKPYEYDPVWMEVKLHCDACLTGYSRVIKGTILELTNPFGQPFFSEDNIAVMEGIVLTIEREPFWTITKPGEIIGPLYNLIDNPDFEIWNFGIVDSQPDTWTDIETTHITGQNSREQTVPKFGQSALKVRVSGSTLAGASKGLTQIIADTAAFTEYTIIAWVRSEGVSNGVGRILINFSSQLELYRESASHGWTLYTGKITTGGSDTVSINTEILTTAANTDGTIYIDGLMFIAGDWEQEAKDNVLPYMTGSHIVNHIDTSAGNIEAGDINHVDAWNLPGNIEGKVRIELTNNSTAADVNAVVEVLSLVRIGMRRTNDIFNFDATFDVSGTALSAASSGIRSLTTSLDNNDWTTVATATITEDMLDNQGRFRLLCRILDPSASIAQPLEIRVEYFVGASSVGLKALDGVTVPVLQQWTVVDLTSNRSLAMDKKFSSDLPAQLGYNIQFRRIDNSTRGQLDYAVRMPTDGGYMEATIDPAVTPGNALVVDGTDVNGTLRRAGWQELRSSPEFTRLTEFNGNLYASGGEGALVGAYVYRLAGDSWQLVLDLPQGANDYNDLEGIEEYNGFLYVGGSSSGDSEPVLRSFFGTTGWSSAFTLSNVDSDPIYLKSFNGFLYVATNNDEIYRWNNSAAALVFTAPAADVIYWLEVYNNRLYASGQTTGNIYEYRIDTNSWTTLTNLGEELWGMKAFGGHLYIGTGTVAVASGDGFIFRYDGSEFVQVADFAETGLDTVRAFNVYQDRIYAGGGPAAGGGTAAAVLVSTDGLTWTRTYDPFPDAIEDIFPLAGLLYICGDDGIHALSDADVQYKVADFSLSPFRAPPRKENDERRHRYFFSYSRENFIDNIDDKALVGLGFTPRYLELPMKEN